MRHHLVIATLLLLAASVPAAAQQVADNPYHTCQRQGLSVGTDAFDECIDRRIAEICTAAGRSAGTEPYARCERRFRDEVLITRYLDQRGYAVDLSLMRFN